MLRPVRYFIFVFMFLLAEQRIVPSTTAAAGQGYVINDLKLLGQR